MHTLTLQDVKDQLDKQGWAIGAVDPKAYHAWKNELPNAISKSGLVDFDHDPYKYKFDLENRVRKETPAMRFGSMVDCIALTPELVDSTYSVEDVNRRTKEGKARVAELEAAGITLVDEEEFALAQEASAVARECIEDIAGGSVATQIGLWLRVTELDGAPLATPIVVTGMLDALPVDATRPIIDLKTTSADLASDKDVEGNIRKFRYGIQAAMYTDLVTACSGNAREFALAYVSSSAPFRARCVRLGAEAVELYRTQYKDALRRFAEACASGDWGSARLDNMDYIPPVWEVEKYTP